MVLHRSAFYATMLLLALVAVVVSGTPLRYVASEEESSNNSTSLVTKLSYNFTAENTDDQYLVQWTAEIHAGDNPDYIDVLLTFNGAIQNEQNWHPDPNGGAGGWSVATGFVVVTPVVGDNIFTIQYASSIAGEPVSMRRTRLLIEPCNLA